MGKTLNASECGVQRIKEAIKNKGWSTNDPRWLIQASKFLNPNKDFEVYLLWSLERLESEIGCLVEPGISGPTWKRFLSGSSIKADPFKAFCDSLELRWRDIVEQIPLDDSQEIVGVQESYSDPKDYVGPVWTQIIPESQNAAKRHMITINWGSWSWQKIKLIPAEGLLLTYRKRLKELIPRIVTVSTFPGKNKDSVLVITNGTKIINSHLIIEHIGPRMEINRGWEELWLDPPDLN
jgi:hypothetical protein